MTSSPDCLGFRISFSSSLIFTVYSGRNLISRCCTSMHAHSSNSPCRGVSTLSAFYMLLLCGEGERRCVCVCVCARAVWEWVCVYIYQLDPGHFSVLAYRYDSRDAKGHSTLTPQ